MSLESFKAFVKQRPSLATYVNNKEKTWQEFYEMYELYGDRSDVWDSYIKSNNVNKPVTIKDLFGLFKNIDMSEMQESINSLQKGIGYIENLVKTRERDVPKRSSYEGRSMYKYYDD